MDWGEVLDELYGLPPGEFTATRDARARQARTAGDKDLAARVTALRRPPAAAWAVNLLVRAQPEQVEQLLALGEAMREAQDALAGPELRALRVQQHQVLEAVRVQAARLVRAAGGKLSPDAGEQVVSVLRAGMTDARAADAVRSGRLVRVLEATGFGEVDTEDAVAGEGTAPARPTPQPAPVREDRAAPTGGRRPPAPPPDELRARREEKERREAERRAAEEERRERGRREHEQAVDRAREDLADAQDADREATAQAGSATTRAGELEQRHEDLLAQVEAVADQLEAARATARAAERAARTAAERRSRAERALERLERETPRG